MPGAVEYCYTENGFDYHEIPYQKNMVLEGYYQSERYFEHCKKYVKSQFKLNDVFTSQEIEPNACFIHVRRGDYKNLTQFHPLQTWDNYYQQAVQRMDTYYPSKYYIFSDEIELVKKEFPDNKYFEYVSGGDEITDMWLMTKCKYQIIGNSSFSWWAAYLSEYKETETIAPANWFGPAYYYHNTKDLLPKSWKTV
jgi:hypothetical protein